MPRGSLTKKFGTGRILNWSMELEGPGKAYRRSARFGLEGRELVFARAAKKASIDLSAGKCPRRACSSLHVCPNPELQSCQRVAGTVSRFEASLRRAKVDLRIMDSAMPRVSQLGADAADAIHSARPDQKGWRRATIWIESIEGAASALLAFGSDIEVLAPEELRRELEKRASSVWALYISSAQAQKAGLAPGG